MLLITIILLILFILNLIIYWLTILKVKNKEKTIVKIFFKLFPLIWTFSLITIPIINSSLLILYIPNNYSYFKYYWIFFALLGIAFIIIGINFAKKARKVYKVKLVNDPDSKLITTGIFRIIRHPIYSAWVIVFLGIALISDSIISLIISPLILIILEIHAKTEEKFILIPKYGKAYENFKNKTTKRIIPSPLNLLLLIITFIIVYVGFLNIT